MNNQLKSILNQYRDYLKQHYQEKLVKVILYGSQARGEAKTDSDIDLLIVLNEPVNAWEEIERTGEFTSDFCLEHDVVISRAFVSLSRFNQESLPFFRNVNREGILV
jgi:predicted nucleotidyltransferase